VSPSEAERVIEALRFGIPPRGHVREFTVGRESQIRGLTRGLEKQSRQLPAERGTALLVRANWGAGKSHLLEVVREVAIEEGYAVALVVANAQGGVRFNRMETILGEACRQIEVPGSERHGLGALLDAYTSVDENRLPATTREMRASISSDGRWDLSNTLRSPAMYVALRAWTVARKGEERTRVETRVEDWFHNPVAYRAQRQLLYRDLVETLRSRFRDPRPDWRFYSDGVFVFNTMGHRQSWDALADLDLLARLSGQRGMVFLIDEFEDVIQNLQRRDYKEAAFLNLFHFFRGEVPSLSYFAVTPEFSAKCKHELLSRGVIDYDFGQFDKLASFELDPIDTEMIVGLAFKIRDVHAVAYGWNAKKAVPERELRDLSRRLGDSALPDRVRQSIVGVVRFLDDRYQA
jgi:hypothetical protein